MLGIFKVFMSLVVLSVVVLMFLFPNALWFSIRLVILTLTVLIRLSSLGLVSALVSFIFILVYLGAIIIVISYICAIIPNSLLTARLKGLSLNIMVLSLFLSFLSLSFMPVFRLRPLNASLNVLALLLNSQYLSAFFVVVLMLFFILLMVTTQYLAPKGPFRSVRA